MVKKMSQKKGGKNASRRSSSPKKVMNESHSQDVSSVSPSGRRLFSPRTWFTPRAMKSNTASATPKKVIKRTRKSKLHKKFLIFRLCSTIGSSAARMTRAIIGGRRKKQRRNRSKKIEVSPSRWSRVTGIFRLRRAVELTPRTSKKIKAMRV